jgi:hypothetical protein
MKVKYKSKKGNVMNKSKRKIAAGKAWFTRRVNAAARFAVRSAAARKAWITRKNWYGDSGQKGVWKN